MISQIKDIKISQLQQEEVEYDSVVAKKEEMLESLKAKEDKNALVESKEVSSLRREIETLKENKTKWKEERRKNITEAKTLKELGVSFEEAKAMLKERGLPLVLTEEDKNITSNESNFEDLSDFVFVHKTRFFPQDGVIRTSKDAGAYIDRIFPIEIDGKKYKVGGHSQRETIHFTLNTEVKWNMGALFRGS